MHAAVTVSLFIGDTTPEIIPETLASKRCLGNRKFSREMLTQAEDSCVFIVKADRSSLRMITHTHTSYEEITTRHIIKSKEKIHTVNMNYEGVCVSAAASLLKK